jgi:cytidylate kinase
MKVITVGREFGSGGREFGKLLAQELGFDYYDDEILTEIAKKSGLAQSYVRSVVEQSSFEDYSVSYGKTFFFNDLTSDNHLKIITSQNDVLLELAQKSDSIFVGRCADVVLDKLNPLKIFVYADMDTKLARSRASTGSSQSDPVRQS